LAHLRQIAGLRAWNCPDRSLVPVVSVWLGFLSLLLSAKGNAEPAEICRTVRRSLATVLGDAYRRQGGQR